MTHLIGFDVFSIVENKIRAVFVTRERTDFCRFRVEEAAFFSCCKQGDAQ
jgi:hypothetical protein